MTLTFARETLTFARESHNASDDGAAPKLGRAGLQITRIGLEGTAG